MWEVRLAELLTAAPGCAAELRTLIASVDQPPVHIEQWNIADGSGTVITALLGNVYLHPDPASAAPPLRRDPQDGPE